MSSIRDQILAHVKTLLNASGKPDGVVVSRNFSVSFDAVNEPGSKQISIAPGEEDVTERGSVAVPKVDRHVLVAITIAGVSPDKDISPDEWLDPVMSWVISQMTKDRTLGGLAIRGGTTEHKNIWAGEPGIAQYGRVHMLWKVKYITSGNSQEQP